MIRVPLTALLLATVVTTACLSGCADGPGHHGGPPPQDPADYHGVPTDTRPPTLAPTPNPQ